MRFRKRLSAVFLAAAMLLTSAQLPGGVSYAAETASGLETVALTAEGTAAASVTQLSEDTEMGGTRSTDGIVTDGAGQKKEEDVTAEDNSQPGGREQTRASRTAKTSQKKIRARSRYPATTWKYRRRMERRQSCSIRLPMTAVRKIISISSF